MITETAISSASVAAQLHALSQAAYAIEAECIGVSDFPPLRESLFELQGSADRLLIFEQSGRIIGALAFATAGDHVNVTRLVVDPAHFRKGIATALLTNLESRVPTRCSLKVATAEANAPAVQLYRRLGYQTVAFTNTPEGIRLIQLAKWL